MMDADFWHDKWEKLQIGFHQSEGNPMLVAHFDALDLSAGASVFVPLCGKSRDIAWLMGKGCRVVAAELSEISVQDLFAEMGVTPQVAQLDDLKCYSADGITVFVGDVFAVTPNLLGPVDAVFDRAALVALPDDLRRKYADHLVQITETAPQLVVTFTYDQAQMKGPPFSITEDMMAGLYAGAFVMTNLETQQVPGGFKGAIPATETAWHLKQS
jgi:thiopurine S-methyltransferase